MTLTEFLLARIAEDEAAARRVGALEDAAPWLRPAPGWSPPPARVIAECEAKRRIVESVAAARWARSLACESCADEFADDILRHLALPYADHPDYREEWRP